MDPVYDLARNVMNLGYNDLPPDVVKTTKFQILDTIGCAIAAAKAPGVPELHQLYKDQGGKPESTVIGYGTKLPAPYAAHVNGVMACALDYDDYQHDSNTHPGCIVVSTAFAMSEALGKVSGKDCLAAIALGGDLMSRIGEATYYEGGVHRSFWHATCINGIFAAAGIAGKLMALDETQMINALGIAFHQAAGNLQCVQDGALTKRGGPGFTVRNGIMSALMAKAGFTGARDIIRGRYNLYDGYHKGGYLQDRLLGGLGKTFRGAELVFKPYPCVRNAHVAIEATLAVVHENNIKPAEVDSIKIFGGRTVIDNLSAPLEKKIKPQSVVDLQFSIPWVVAAAIVKGNVGISTFAEEMIAEPDILKMATKITTEKDPTLFRNDGEPCRIQITTKRGTFTKQVDNAKGDPENPMTTEDVTTKFLDCASLAMKPMSKKTIDNVIDTILNLDKLDDAAKVMKLMC